MIMRTPYPLPRIKNLLYPMNTSVWVFIIISLVLTLVVSSVVEYVINDVNIRSTIQFLHTTKFDCSLYYRNLNSWCQVGKSLPFCLLNTNWNIWRILLGLRRSFCFSG